MAFKSLILFIMLLGGVLPAVKAAEGERSSGVIGRMDNVEIRVFREDELTTRGQLSGDGTISMPLIGSIGIQGLTTDQAAAAITRKLADGYLEILDWQGLQRTGDFSGEYLNLK